MKLLRRRFLHLAAAAVVCPAAPYLAGAQSYPTRPVHLIEALALVGQLDPNRLRRKGLHHPDRQE
jgi:hypothetical protein